MKEHFLAQTYDSRSRRDVLRSLRKRVHAVDTKNHIQFQEIMRASQNLLELSEQEVADALLVSRPTVNRWINGKNLPHPALRKSIFKWVNSQVKRRIRLLDAIERQTDSKAAQTSVPVGGIILKRK